MIGCYHVGTKSISICHPSESPCAPSRTEGGATQAEAVFGLLCGVRDHEKTREAHNLDRPCSELVRGGFVNEGGELGIHIHVGSPCRSPTRWIGATEERLWGSGAEDANHTQRRHEV